jgi:hypothetical protein
VLRLTLAPTFNAAVKLAVAGSLAVFNVPEVIVVALAAMISALEYAAAAKVVALATALATALAKAVAAVVFEYALRVVDVLPPTVLASTLVTDDPTPEKDPAVIRPVNVAVLPIMDVELTVTLPTLILVVLAVTTEPTFNAVVKLAVAGSLAVSRVPEEILVALIEVISAPLPEIVVVVSAPMVAVFTEILVELAIKLTVVLPIDN